MVYQRQCHNQGAGNGSDGRSQMDDALGHNIILAGLIIIGVTAALLGLLAILVIVIIVVQIIGVIHLGAFVIVLIIVKQTALGGVTANALGFLIHIIVGVALRLKGGGGLLRLIDFLRRNLLLAVLGLCLAGGIYFGSEAIYKANNQRLIEQLRSQEDVDLPTKQELDENYRDVDIWINEDGFLTDGVSNQGTLKEDMGTLNGRKDTWSAIVEAFRNSKDLRLFGTSRFRDRILPGMAHAHNSWLQMMVQLGIPGLVFSLVLTAEILIACARVLLRCRDKAKITMTMWVLCMLPIGFMEPFLFNAGHVGDLFILVSGYLWAWGRKRD